MKSILESEIRYKTIQENIFLTHFLLEVFGKVQLQTDIKKADREFKNELSYGQNDNSTKDINTASNKVIEKNNSSNKYGVSSYSIKNQKMNYECGEGESL